MKQLTLKREICDTLAMIAITSVACLIWEAILIRIILALCFTLCVVEMTATSYRKDIECYPTKAAMLFTFPALIIQLFAAAFVISFPLEGKRYALVLALAMASDAGGLIFGRFFGHKKPFFSKKISPNKTWGGYLGSLICTWAVGLFVNWVLQLGFTRRTLILIGSSFIIASIGDLIGSGTKRELGIKHSNEYALDIPVLRQIEVLMRSRHGFLDCFDSVSCLVIFATILFA